MATLSQTIESTLTELRVFNPPLTFEQHAAISGMASYQALSAQFFADYEGTWAQLARQHLHWQAPFTQTLNEVDAPHYRWFEEGTLNASYQSLDVPIAQGQGDKTAIVFEADDGENITITYRELHRRVCKVANALKSKGITQGDRVLIYMPMSIEGIVAMQACARIGATHSVVFGGFSAKSVQDRLLDVGASAIITSDEQVRAGKALPIKNVIDEALQGVDVFLKTVIVYRRTGGKVAMQADRDVWLHELEAASSPDCEPTWVNAEHPLFILYTSGSTGKPKGIVHSTAGYLLWAKLTMLWSFDIKSTDVYWCTADIGWITGHTYVAYGPLATGTTQIVFEGVPTYPNAGRFWEMIEKHRVSVFYTAPTAIRSLIKAAEADALIHPKQFDLSSLRLLGSVGEPINPEAWMWYYTHIGGGRCPIVDTFWQTETGGHVISPMPGATPLVPGSCTLPLPGIMAAVVDETGRELPNGQGGLLVIKRPWPSMVRNVWGDADRFKTSYFPVEMGGKFYLAGDGAVRSSDRGYFTIMGRIDDVLNVSGHRMGTMEIESALVSCTDLVAEAAVVGRPDDVSGEAICAFVVLKRSRPTGDEALAIAKQLRDWVAKEIGPIAKPKDIRFGDNLPKTRSGKIMRRLLRSIAKGEVITQDVSTLENPAILLQLAEKA
jgi:acetyl-CoA synthetase